MTDEPQIDKFREIARELECDESEEDFDKKMRMVAKQMQVNDEALKKARKSLEVDEGNFRDVLERIDKLMK